LDGLDGLIARKIGSKNNFGKFLDAIADTVSFCFAPAVLLYGIYYIPTETSFTNIVNLMTVLASFLVVGFGILRLARFISAEDKKNNKTNHNNTFIGLPTPAMALFVVILLLPTFCLYNRPEIVLPVVAITALLMISDVPYPAFKGKTAMATGVLVLLVIFSLLLNFIYSEFIHLLALGLILCYIFIIPFFIRRNPRESDKNGKNRTRLDNNESIRR
jgi:CDP-diacylglycerol--serine O-phosphatidyltransferase